MQQAGDLLPRPHWRRRRARASVVSSLLARSITRPLRQITDASEEMARPLRPAIPATAATSRQVGGLNHMARVGRSHRLLRDFLANVSHELKPR
jgi:signal transduction histidine kinase